MPVGVEVREQPALRVCHVTQASERMRFAGPSRAWSLMSDSEATSNGREQSTANSMYQGVRAVLERRRGRSGSEQNVVGGSLMLAMRCGMSDSAVRMPALHPFDVSTSARRWTVWIQLVAPHETDSAEIPCLLGAAMAIAGIKQNVA